MLKQLEEILIKIFDLKSDHKKLEKLKIKDNIDILKIGIEIDNVQLMLARDQLLLLCGLPVITSPAKPPVW